MQKRDEATYHFVASPDKDRHGARVCTLFDHEHFVAGRTKRHFADNASLAQLLRRKIFKSRKNTTLSGYCDQLYSLLAYNRI